MKKINENNQSLVGYLLQTWPSVPEEKDIKFLTDGECNELNNSVVFRKMNLTLGQLMTSSSRQLIT